MSAIQAWGVTEREEATQYPATQHLPDAASSLYRAIDIDAPAAVVFRWLCQLRVAPYSYDVLDNLGRRSPRKLTPGLEQLERGQKFMIIYELVEFERDRHITVRIKHLRGAFGDQVVSYVIDRLPNGGSRLIANRRLKPPRGPHGPLIALNLPVIDLIMTRKQLRTLKKLAERQARDGD